MKRGDSVFSAFLWFIQTCILGFPGWVPLRDNGKNDAAEAKKDY
jgi:hypothetical protein